MLSQWSRVPRVLVRSLLAPVDGWMAGATRAIGPRHLWTTTVLVALVFLGGGRSRQLTAQVAENVTVDVRVGQSVRDIAAEHLGDPDLWSEIMKANALASITEIRPGTRLVVPVGRITRATQALADASEQVQRANAAGARLFATATVGRAIALRDQALERRQAGEWEAAASIAREAATVARTALEETLAQRRADAEAVLADRRGNVEQRRPTDLDWGEVGLNAVLVKEERVRTLSNSTCQIRFLDDSRLRLGANSQAVIRTLQIDRLTRNGEASVSLVEGDVHALLGGNRSKRRFNLEVPGVGTQFESNNFWVSREEGSSKFANYDDRAATITSEGRTVTLMKNEGTEVGRAVQIAVRRLLDAPQLQTPPDDAPLSQEDVELAWALVVGASSYSVEVAADQQFDRMVVNRGAVGENRALIEGLEDGTYYWRVSAIDELGLPGPTSETQRFTVRADAYAPYLVIQAPADGTILRYDTIEVVGLAERGVRVELDGRPVTVAPDGRFTASHRLRPGLNELAFEARDAANHVTRRSRSVIVMPDVPVGIEYAADLVRVAPREFISPGAVFTLGGTTAASSLIHVRDPGGATRATAYTDEAGTFLLNIPVTAPGESLTLVVTSPSGFETHESFTVTVDRDSPGLTVDAVPPRATRDRTLRLRGRVRDASVLQVNGNSVALAGGQFDEAIELQDGANELEVRAADAVGYVSLAQWTVLVDRDAPELVSQRVTHTRLATGAVLDIEVRARDASEMQQTARVELRGGDIRRTAVLRLDRSTASYRGVLYVTGDRVDTIELRSVELVDYLGNGKQYQVP